MSCTATSYNRGKKANEIRNIYYPNREQKYPIPIHYFFAKARSCRFIVTQSSGNSYLLKLKLRQNKIHVIFQSKTTKFVLFHSRVALFINDDDHHLKFLYYCDIGTPVPYLRGLFTVPSE